MSDDDEALTLGGVVYVVACGCGDRGFSHLGEGATFLSLHVPWVNMQAPTLVSW
jgi:hypothetical protein